MFTSIEQIDNPTDIQLEQTVINNNIKNNNNDNTTFSLESFFANLPSDKKERKKVMSQFKKTLKQEKSRLKELKNEKKLEKRQCKNGKHGKNGKNGNHQQCHQKEKRCVNNKIENKIERLNRKKYLLIAKAQYIESKISILIGKYQSRSNNFTTTYTVCGNTQSKQPIDNSCSIYN